MKYVVLSAQHLITTYSASNGFMSNEFTTEAAAEECAREISERVGRASVHFGTSSKLLFSYVDGEIFTDNR